MAKFVIAGVTLSILIGVASCPDPPENIWRTNFAIEKICNERSFENFIECEVAPGRFKDFCVAVLEECVSECFAGMSSGKGASFNPEAIRRGLWPDYVLIPAKVKPSPLAVHPSASSTSSARNLIWRVNFGGWTPIEKEISVRRSFVLLCYFPMSSSSSLPLHVHTSY